jgi:predicted alpha/beta-fold hydrolase
LFKKQEKEYGYDTDDILNNTFHIREFDSKIVPHVNGFGKDLKKFYYNASSAHYIKDLEIPSLLIHSLDDPVCIKE